MDRIESRPLQPLNPGTAITEHDRSRVYSTVGRELNNLLNGPASYYADGVRKDGQTLLSDLNGFKTGIRDLQGVVNDPTNILGGVIEHLDSFTQMFEKRLNVKQPNDDIQLKPEYAPNTEDNNIIYVNPNTDPRDSFPNSNPVAPENWSKYQDASLGNFERSNLRGQTQRAANGVDSRNQVIADTWLGNNSPSVWAQTRTPTENTLLASNGVRGLAGARPQASQPMASQPAPMVQNLTTHVLRMKGVPEADIAAAINEPRTMQNLLNQLYGHRSTNAPGNDSGIFGNPFGQAAPADQPRHVSTPTAATPGGYLPFGWSGLEALLR